MENKLKNAFDRVTMPDQCVEKIEQELANSAEGRKGYYASPVQPGKGSWVLGLAAAALAVCAVAIGIRFLAGYQQAAAVPVEETESTAEAYGEAEETQGIEDESLRLREQSYLYIVDENGRVLNPYNYAADAHAESAPEWIVDEEGRLYFAGTGEKLDITDAISVEVPFLYIGTDLNGAKWAYAVGRITDGPYVDIGNSVGWFIFNWDADMNCWIRDSGTHWSNWMDCEWPWLTRAEAILAGTADSNSGTVPMPPQSE